MLVLSRKEGESIEFRDLNICVRVMQLKKSKVQLGIDAPHDIRVDRTETLARKVDEEHLAREKLPRSEPKFDLKRTEESLLGSKQRLLNELAKLEVEVMTLAELVTSKDQKLARQTALVSLERLHAVRKTLKASCPVNSSCRTNHDSGTRSDDRSRSAGKVRGSTDAAVHKDGQELVPLPASQSSIDCVRQSGVGYFLDSELPGFSEQTA